MPPGALFLLFMPIINGTSYTFMDLLSGDRVINGSLDKWTWTEQLVNTTKETDLPNNVIKEEHLAVLTKEFDLLSLEAIWLIPLHVQSLC